MMTKMKTLVEQLENASKTFAKIHNGLDEDLIVAAMAIGADLAIKHVQEMEANLFKKIKILKVECVGGGW
jgi:hypothetical protein